MTLISPNTRHTVLAESEDGVMLCLFVLTPCRHVTARRTETLYLTQRTALRRAVIKVICSDKDRSTSSSAYTHITVSML